MVHLSEGIAFGGVDTRWGASPEYNYKVIDPATGLRYSGITPYQAIGVQQIIRSMQYNYERGIRRFCLNDPHGTVSVTSDGYCTYGGIWDCMRSKSIERPWDGTRFANPYYNCWPELSNGDTLPTYSTNPSDPYNTLTFNPDGRWSEFFVLLRVWLGSNSSYGYDVGLDGVTPMSDKRNEVEIILYTGFGIPTNGVGDFPDHEVNYTHIIGVPSLQNRTDGGHGFQMPDPENNAAHAAYLDRFKNWYTCGITGVGADVGLFAFNYEKGDWIYNNPVDMPSFHYQKHTNMRRYLQKEYDSLPLSSDPDLGEVKYQDREFAYFAEGHPWNWNKKHAVTYPDIDYPVVGTSEYLDLFGITELHGDNTAHIGSWQHYCKYIQLYQGLSQFNNGTWQGGSGTAFNGADPNRKWRFNPDTTEIHLLITTLPTPYFDISDANMAAVDADIDSAENQEKIQLCIDYWIDYIDRGYVYQPTLYWNSYQVYKQIHKGIMQYLGEWPDSDPEL